MARTLDLSVFMEDTFDIKFKDNEILKVKKPSENIAIQILAHVNLKTNDMKPEEMMETTRGMTKAILNNNKEGKEYTDEWIKENLPLNMQVAIIQGYSNFMSELEQNPNS